MIKAASEGLALKTFSMFPSGPHTKNNVAEFQELVQFDNNPEEEIRANTRNLQKLMENELHSLVREFKRRSFVTINVVLISSLLSTI